MVRITATISVLAFLAASHAEARPVSYQGGWTVIEQTDRQSTALWVHYTINPHLSLGWRTEWDRREDFIYNGPKATVLAKRWFGENYQANIYGVASAGGVTGVGDNPLETSAAGFVGAMADWETRSLFVSYSARVMDGENIDSMFMHAARVGFAPYVGNTGDLHTWLMIEVDHRPDNDEKVGVTPLVRFFKGGALFEAGWSITDNQPLINFTYRF